MDLSALFSALLMGIVEGFTEFLPISSTGHLILLGELIGFEGPPGKVFEISIQLGAILAVCWIYRGLILDLLRGMWQPGRERYYVINLMLAFLPAAIIGLLFHKTITTLLFNPWVVSIALILGGIAIIAIEKLRPAPSIHSVPEIGPLAAVLVGLGQALAMIPGTSRSGATIIGAMAFGLSRQAATEFSFFLAIPTLFGATVYSLYKERALLSAADLPMFGLGALSAFISAFLCVRWLLRYISSHDFMIFAWYRIVFGVIVLVTALTGWVQWAE